MNTSYWLQKLERDGIKLLPVAELDPGIFDW